MAADERVHKKAHFGPLPESRVSNHTEPEPGPALSEAPKAGAEPAQQLRGREQPQALSYPDHKEAAYRRDIYSIHGEQVTLACFKAAHQAWLDS